MKQLNSSTDGESGKNGYLYAALPPENVFGHTKKVRLFREVIERVRRECGRESLRILDIGCGSGYAVTRFLGKAGDDVLGIDMYPPNIAFAEAQFEHDGLHFACMNVNSLKADGSLFDIVVLADVLEHLDDPASILATAGELLAPDGRLLVTVPNGRGPFEIESSLSRVPVLGFIFLKLTDYVVAIMNKTILKEKWSRMAASVPSGLPYNIDSGHVQFFTNPKLMTLIHAAELKVVRSSNLSFLSGPFTNYFFAPFQGFCKWNVHIAERLPHCLSSAWFVECRKDENRD